jgi:hypothetical protein
MIKIAGRIVDMRNTETTQTQLKGDTMFNLTKTTENMAARRGICLFITDNDQNVPQSMFRRHEDDTVRTIEISVLTDGEAADEYDAIYRLTVNGLYYMGSMTGRGEEFPHYIGTDKALRGLLPAMADVVSEGR